MDQRLADSWTWRGVYALVLVIVIGAFLFTVRGILNPFLLFLLVVALGSPFSRAPSYRILVSAAGLITLLWLLSTLGSLLAPFFLALGLAYVLYPLVRKVERKGISRGLAIGILSLPMIAALALMVFVGIPALGRQLADLINGIPGLLQSLVTWVERMQLRLARSDLPMVDEGVLVERLRAIRPDEVLGYLQARQAEIGRRAWTAVVGAGKGVSLVLTILGYLFLTPILTFYLLRDWERITRGLAELIPGGSRAGAVAFFGEYDRLLAGYLRGTLLQSSIAGLLTTLGLWAMGIPYAFLLGLTAAIFNIIPYVGLILTLIPAIFVALFTDNVLLSIGKVVVVFVVVQALDGAVVGPRIVGGSVGLHPVWVILALSVAGFFWGFLGLLLAVPLAVLVKLLLAVAVERYRRSQLFLGENA